MKYLSLITWKLSLTVNNNFSFDLPSVLWAKRVRRFNLKFGNLTTLITCSVDCAHVCNMIFINVIFANILIIVSLCDTVLEIDS